MRIGTGPGNPCVVMLNHDTKLYPHHVDPNRPWDFSRPVAEVTRHPQDPGRWGLKNLTDGRWNFTPPGGAVADLDPGKNVPLANGTRINFNGAEAEVRFG